LEKSLTPQSNLASMGIYVFNKGILTERLIEDAGDPLSQHDFGYSLLPNMVKQDRVFAYRFNGYWQDIGTIEAYYDANIELTKEQPSFSLNGTYPILTQEQRLSPPYIGKQASIKNSLISPGCVIRGCVENSILSPQVCVDEQAVVRDSVIMENTYIGYHSIVDHCVLDEEVNIGKYCCVGFGPNLTPSDPDVTVLGKGVNVPSYTTIGQGCKISPHIDLADFTTNVVSAGTVVSRRAAVEAHC
jgi:glucose-1-phosphate adenylyltransferase